ncbi:hypothetical protein [Pelagibius sp. Alg239-R121]|uniref:DUF6898 family protein n=1 Tax=Pelagibius sp. Alg239-R121 TaxID=2993448 RepID=UPI0024A6BF7E|nr:hypothetical protein [Pelagibius sp. Alg239-R121]
MKETDVIVEFVRLGAYVRVSAMHAPTMIEAIIVGPPSAGEYVLRQNALRKLKYLLSKSQTVGSARPGILA